MDWKFSIWKNQLNALGCWLSSRKVVICNFPSILKSTGNKVLSESTFGIYFIKEILNILHRIQGFEIRQITSLFDKKKD